MNNRLGNTMTRWRNRVVAYMTRFCGNCMERPGKHTSSGACLFNPTRFREPTFEEAECVAAKSEPDRVPINRREQIKLDERRFPVIRVPNRHTDRR